MDTATLTIDAERAAKSAFLSFTGIIDSIRCWRERRRRATQDKKRKETDARFDIEHREGRIFLTCDGVAFEEIEGGCTIEDAAALLRLARENANRFRNLNRY